MPGEIRVLPAQPRVGRLLARAVAGSVGRRPGGGPAAVLPDRSVRLLDQAQDPARLAAYARVCGFTLRDRVPATWLHVLTFPLHAHLMAERDFPFRLAGLVHAHNDMTLHRPVRVSDRLSLGVRAGSLRPHRRGMTVDLVGEVHVGDELAWSGVSTYLARGPGSETTAAAGISSTGTDEAASHDPSPDIDLGQRWRLPPDLGRRYAAVSGDVNPIHLSPLTARVFGFPRPIVHGLWTHARVLAALEGVLPEAYRVEVRFTRPIMLPATVRFGSTVVDGVRHFAVAERAGDRTHLVGSLEATDA